MYERLAPGGLLVIGNMKAGTDMIWPLEFIEDWSLNYRTPEEMRALVPYARGDAGAGGPARRRRGRAQDRIDRLRPLPDYPQAELTARRAAGRVPAMIAVTR